MKLLVLNSKLDLSHPIFQSFIENEWGFIFVDNAQELWEALELHGKSIDLALFKYEDISNGFLKKLKAHPVQQDLPYIITYENLTLDECVNHQKSESGAHAYFQEPLEPKAFLQLLKQVLPDVSSSPSQDLKENVFQLEFEEKSKKTEDVPFLKEMKNLSKETSDIPSLPELPSLPDLESEEKVKEEFPYLFDQYQNLKEDIQSEDEVAPMEDVVVNFIPGAYSGDVDLDTLKKYLELREKDVYVLSKQNKSLKEELQKSKENLKIEKIRYKEVEFSVKEQQRKIQELQNEINIIQRTHEAELEDIKIVQKDKNTKIKILEDMLSSHKEEQNKLKDRVRSDIRKIRMREKELENRLEILRKDSEALLGSREGKILDLKRKLDLTEFNLDLMQEQNQKEKEKITKLKEKLQRASQAMRLAGGFLGEEHTDENDDFIGSELMKKDDHKKIS